MFLYPITDLELCWRFSEHLNQMSHDDNRRVVGSWLHFQYQKVKSRSNLQTCTDKALLTSELHVGQTSDEVLSKTEGQEKLHWLTITALCFPWKEWALASCRALWKQRCDTMTDRVLSHSLSCWWWCIHCPKKRQVKKSCQLWTCWFILLFDQKLCWDIQWSVSNRLKHVYIYLPDFIWHAAITGPWRLVILNPHSLSQGQNQKCL